MSTPTMTCPAWCVTHDDEPYSLHRPAGLVADFELKYSEDTGEAGSYWSAISWRPDGDVETHDDTAAGLATKLRSIAADALTAAEWLEARS